MHITYAILLATVLLTASPATAAVLDFKQAVIVVGNNPAPRMKKAAAMLAEEIEKRTQLRLMTVAVRKPGSPAIVIGKQAGGVAEGYSIATSIADGSAVATVTGNDERGMIFGTGYLLRQFRMGRQKLEIDSGVMVRSAPKTQVRGHQLGYRPKTNSYDAWSVAMWEQYIRDLAVFGTNAMELMPPRTDDDAGQPAFPAAADGDDGRDVADRR